jgi:Spy/CpxP family protein refolding chaperone
MKKMILGLAALLMVSFSFAQPNQQHHAKRAFGQHNRGMQFKKLNLTDAQKEQMKTVNADFHKQLKALNAKEDITVKEQRSQRAALAKAHKASIESIFTAEQKAQLVQMKAERQNKMGEMGAKRLDQLKDKLSLTDAQVTKLKAGQEATKAKKEAIIKNEQLTQDDKKQQLMALRGEMKKNMDEILTAEQKAKMQELRKDRSEKMKHFRGKRSDKMEVK